MVKRTTTLIDIIQSELILSGKNEFFNNNQITIDDDKYAFIKKIMRYDDDVHEIVTLKFFQGYVLEDVKIDRLFKKTFCNRFLNREIGRQTLEDFSSQVLYNTLTLEMFIINAYTNGLKFMNGENLVIGMSKANHVNDYRTLFSELPQTEINLNVDNTVLDYGNTNTISRTKDVNDNDNKQTSNNYDINKFKETFLLFKMIYDEIDRKCFLQIG